MRIGKGRSLVRALISGAVALVNQVNLVERGIAGTECLTLTAGICRRYIALRHQSDHENRHGSIAILCFDNWKAAEVIFAAIARKQTNRFDQEWQVSSCSSSILGLAGGDFGCPYQIN
jgi:hypothetical protein